MKSSVVIQHKTLVAIVFFVSIHICQAMKIIKNKCSQKNNTLCVKLKKKHTCNCDQLCKNISQTITKNCPTCCLKIITQNHEDVNGIDPKNSLPFLHSALNLKRADIIFLLLEHKANPHEYDYCNRNPLFYAHDKEIVEILLLYGANNKSTDDNEQPNSVLIDTINSKNIEITELFLLYGADLFETDNNSKHNVLHSAINVAHSDLCKSFLDWPYILAESKGLFDQIKLLCSRSNYLNQVICYLLFLFKKIGQTLNLKIPKLIQITLIENCMSDHLKKLWQSPYAQEIQKSKDPQKIAFLCIQKLISQKNMLNKTPLEFVSSKLMINLQDTNLVVDEDNKEKNLKTIHQILFDKNKEHSL